MKKCGARKGRTSTGRLKKGWRLLKGGRVVKAKKSSRRRRRWRQVILTKRSCHNKIFILMLPTVAMCFC